MEKKAGIVVGACALACTAVGLWVAGGFAVASEAVYPAEKSANWFRRNVSCRVRTLWRRQNFAAENMRLRRENDALKMALLDAERNAVPAKGGGKEAMSPGSWIQAPVLSRSGHEGSKCFLRIGAGSRAGVEKGAAVAVPDGLVGVVSQVSPNTCTITLLSDPSVKVACEIETGDESLGAVYGIVSGDGSRTAASTRTTVLYAVNPLRLGHLRDGFKAPPRARVVTSGLGGVFPKGIAIGWLMDGARANASGLEYEGEVAPAVDFPALEEVFIRRED